MKRRAIAGLFLASIVLASCASTAGKPFSTSPFLSARSEYSAIIKSFQGPVSR